MPRRSLPFTILGLLILIGSGTNKWLGWIGSITWLQQNAPDVYTFLMNPTTEWLMIISGLGLSALGLYEIWKYKHTSRSRSGTTHIEQEQTTHGRYSPIAGRDVTQIFHAPAQPSAPVVKRPRISVGGYEKCGEGEALMYGPYEFLLVSNDGDDSAHDIKIVPLRVGEWNVEFDQLALLKPAQTARIRVRSIKKTVGYDAEAGIAKLQTAQGLDSAWRDAITSTGDLGKIPIKVFYRDFKPTHFRTVCSIQRDVLNRGGLPFLIEDCQDVEVEPLPPLRSTY
jgi:hypothetical protein